MPRSSLNQLAASKKTMTTDTSSTSSNTSCDSCEREGGCCAGASIQHQSDSFSSETESHHHPHSCLVLHTQQESLNQSYGSSRHDGSHTVQFSTLHIREHGRICGDNPGCRTGVSLTLEWDVQSEVVVDLETYESARPARRDRNELIIPPDVRMTMMRESGFSRGEIMEAVKRTNVARQQRMRTNETKQLAAAQELTERVFRGVLNKSFFRGKKKHEKQLLQAHILQDQKRLESRRLTLLATPETTVFAKSKKCCDSSSTASVSTKGDEATLGTCPSEDDEHDEECDGDEDQEEVDDDVEEQEATAVVELATQCTVAAATAEVEC